MRRALLALATLAVLGVAAGGAGSATATPYDGVWIRVDTERSVTEVLRNQKSLLVLDRVAFGRGGVANLRLRGGNKTPLGEFRISRVNRESRFHLFLGIDYPRLEHIDAAYRRGILTPEEYQRSLDHGLRHGQFPQNGPLGGHIGFHGIGRGDPDIHDRFHWTEGCIAMTNEQIEKLHRLVDVGTPVVIQ